MAEKLTNEQQAAVDSRERSLLVSAAAGSGKTAVLTEALNRLKQSIDGYEEELEQSELVKAPENSKD